MAEEIRQQNTIEQEVIDNLRQLPPERAQEVLDFVIFLRARVHSIPSPQLPVIRATPSNGDAAWDSIFETEGEAVDAWVDDLLAENAPSTPIDASGNVLKRP